jgi:hypothetical protein
MKTFLLPFIQLAGLCALLTSFPLLAAAHPFHISTAEVEFDPQTNRMQVSLKLHALDLEQALSKRAKQPIRIENKNFAKLLTGYLDRHFYIENRRTPEAHGTDIGNQPPGSKTDAFRSRAKVIGHELEATWLWIYFELELPGSSSDLPDLSLTNTVLLDTVEGQINTLILRNAMRRTALKMTEKHPSISLEPEWLNLPLTATGQ